MKDETKEVYVAVKYLSVIWRNAQRPYQEAWAKKIADNFDTDKFDPPVITKPNGAGYYHIVEGQHRVGAVKIIFGENEQLKCRMVNAQDPARAAEIFLGISAGRKAIKPVAKFLVAVTAMREPETTINKLVAKMGYRIMASKADFCISAVSALVSVHERQGMMILQATLGVLDKSWRGDAAAFQGDIVKGYAVFINEFHTALDNKRLQDVVPKAFSPNQLLSASRLYADQHNESLLEGISEVLRSKYNRGLKEAQKLKRK
jgi:ParB-like nuclease domain